MEQKHRTILRNHKSNLEKDLEPKDILSKLATVLTEKDEEKVRAQHTREGRCDKLFDILSRKGPNTFNVFVESLKEEANHLALVLIEADKAETARVQSANLRGEILKLKTELEAEKQDHINTSQELKELKSYHEISKTETSEQIQKLADIIQQLGDEASSRFEGLKDERDSTRRENETLLKEIQELKKKSEDYQGQNQALHKNLQSLLWKLETANEEQQQKLRQPQRKNKELEDKVTNRTWELKELLAEIIHQHRDESCSRCANLRNERDSTIREIQTLRKEIQELKKAINVKLSKDYQPNTQTPQRSHQSSELKSNHVS